jgi:CheY-like chemotaxis protein
MPIVALYPNRQHLTAKVPKCGAAEPQPEFLPHCHSIDPGRPPATLDRSNASQRLHPSTSPFSRRATMRHVLVVDHQPHLCTLVQHVLERTGEYRVSCAGSGEQALAVLDRDRPNLVMLDIMMPGMPGIELAAHATQRGVPIIATTDQQDVDARLSRLGWPSLAKPFRLELLLDECRATIAETQENLRIVRASLERLLATTGDVRDLVAKLGALREHIGATLETSRRLHH